MKRSLEERTRTLREVFQLDRDVELLHQSTPVPDPPPDISRQLEEFNMEWHVVPSGSAVPFNSEYLEQFYPTRSREFASVIHLRHKSYQEALSSGHRRHQGRVLAVETTRKPGYLPGNRQYYGTAYGFDSTADPFARYLGRAGFVTGTRYSHDYVSLREFIDVVNRDWRERGIMPGGYRLTICPPAVFNLIGTVFHPEWSETESLELGFYRDEHGNATCYAVGSNAPGDFSYIHEVETDSDWTLLGFRTALVCD